MIGSLQLIQIYLVKTVGTLHAQPSYLKHLEKLDSDVTNEKPTPSSLLNHHLIISLISIQHWLMVRVDRSTGVSHLSRTTT